MPVLTKLLSLLTAGTMLISGAVYEAAPQHDADGLLFLVNRQYTLSASYTPEDLEMSDVPGQVRRMRPDAAAALKEMFQACKEETKCQLISISGFRSYEKQAGIYSRKLRSVRKDVAKAQEYVAPPGASEHQTGLAMDIGQKHKETLEVSFRDTEGGKWCAENCWRFGFILRYGEGEEWESITGYKYEPWHFRYVGKEFAKAIHEANVPLETWLIDYRIKTMQDMIGRVPIAATPTDLE